MRYAFASDNTSGVSPEILSALMACNEGKAAAYGQDNLSARLKDAFSDIFEKETFVFPVPTGTAGNGLALGAITPSYGTIFCHQSAHVLTTEGGTAEFFTSGGRLHPVAGDGGRITPDGLLTALKTAGSGGLHQMAATTLTLTQATEAGTVYSLEDLATLTEAARSHGLKTHMDGARFANALVSLNCAPADLTWRSGIDLLTFGSTKNGTLNAEAVVTFDAGTAKVLKHLHKRAGYLASKSRFASAQLLAYLENGLWLKNAGTANTAASLTASWLTACPGVELAYPVETNQVFLELPPPLEARLNRAGISFRPWPLPGYPEARRLVFCFADEALELAPLRAALEPAGSNATGA